MSEHGGVAEEVSDSGKAARPPAIVLGAFGSARPEAAPVHERIEARVRQRFCEHEVRWAFTSERVRRDLAERGRPIDSPEEALAQLRDEGYARAVVQSLHLSRGQMHEELVRTFRGDRSVVLGAPLMSTPRDIEAVADALASQTRPRMPNVLVCHGNNRYPQFDEPNLALADGLRKRFDNLFAASIEGRPGLDPLQAVRRQARRAGAVHFIPVLLVVGKHVAQDVMGDGPESWKRIVGAERATCAPPLGLNDRAIDLFLTHLGAALAELQAARDLHA